MWLIVVVTISATLAMHLFVPGLAGAGADLHASVGQMQLAISLYLLGLAVGQFTYGPVADAYGRRPVLLVGLAVFAAGSVAAAAATSLGVLLGARIVQALGACAGMVLGRTIVRDTTQAEDTVRRLALLNACLMFSPTLGPLFGNVLATGFGWRSIFVALALMGGIACLFAWRCLPETGAPTHRLVLREALSGYGALLAAPGFFAFAIAGGAVFTATYAMVAAAPYILTRQLGVSEHWVGACIALVGVGSIAGNAATSALARRVRTTKLLVAGIATSIVASSMLAALVATAALDAPSLVVLMVLYNVGAGMAMPVTLARALAIRPKLAGSAVGLCGCTQMVFGTLGTSLSAWGNDPVLSCTAVLGGFALLACGAAALALSQAGKQ